MSEWIDLPMVPRLPPSKDGTYRICTHEWINVKDRLPNENEFVLATDGKNTEKVRFMGVRNRLQNGKFFHGWFIGHFSGDYAGTFSSEPYSYNEYMDDCTHWMPLPEPPKDES